MDRRNDGAFVNRGIAYRRVGDLDRAIRDYDEAIRLNPQAADAFNNRGNAIRLNPHYAHANNRGIIFIYGTEYAIALFSRGVARQRDGDPSGLADMEKARRLLPDVADVVADSDDR